VSGSEFGLPVAFEVSVRVALFAPTLVGVNVTVTAHLPRGAIGPVHVLLCTVNIAAFEPVMLAVIRSGFAPVFVTLTVFDVGAPTRGVPNANAVCDNVIVVAGGAAPVPESDTVFGLDAAFEAIDTVAVLVPAAVGVNVTEMLQLPPAAIVVLAQRVAA